jgi:ADP-heptose:LPS heptosyltransferase
VKAIEFLERCRLACRKRKPLGKVESIILVCTRPLGIGDLIMDTPFILTLRKAYPQARIDLLTDKDILVEDRSITRIHLLPKDREAKATLVKGLREERYDLAIVMNRGLPQQWLARRLKPRHLVGYLAGSQVRATFPLKERNGFIKEEHFWNMALKIGRSMGMKPVKRLIPLRFNAETERKVKELLREAFPLRKRKRPLIIISPYVLWESRKWDEHNYVRLIKALRGRYDIMMVGTTQPQELLTLQTIKRGLGDGIPVITGLKLKESACLISKADLFISSDCGPMHLAFATGTKTLSIFGPVKPEYRLPPRKKKHVALWAPQEEMYNYDHETVNERTIQGIDVESVIEEADRMLKGRKGGRR